MYTVRQLSIEFLTWHIVETVKDKHLQHDIHTSDYHRLLTLSHNKMHRVSSQLITHRIIQFVVHRCSRHRWSHDHVTRDWRSRNARPSLVDDCDRDLLALHLPDPSSELVSFYGVLRPSRTSSYVGHCHGRLGQPREGAQAFDAVLTVRN